MKQSVLPGVYVRLLAGAVLPALSEVSALRRSVSPQQLPGLMVLLSPGSQDLRNEATARAHVRLTFGIVLRGAAILASHDPAGRAAIAGAGDGLALFRIPEVEFTGWLHLAKGVLRSGTGTPPVGEAVTLVIPRFRTALAALRNELDTLAAVGARDIVITGRIPLADALNLVLDRMADYFPKKP
jgi:hypothetical protein